ncbi:MAG: hypothetical protein OEZ68_20010 [Gammaproteobacteria bacterium]|nr:hypothetical protein [Gammaproteobacteria bacterium]MDH5803094.1 hypothetical protein [Gammaproteobacteria bacterium]
MFKSNHKRTLMGAICASAMISTGTATAASEVIFDNTATPHAKAIQTNMAFIAPGGKSQTGVEGPSGNAINTDQFKVANRVIGTDGTHSLSIDVGVSPSTVAENQAQTPEKYNFFTAGQHLFDLQRLRTTADWLSANVSPDLGIGITQYGTITLKEFLANVQNGTPMYGIVRVLIGLEKPPGAAKYGFCNGALPAPSLCECAPGTSVWSDIEANATSCGITFNKDSRIDVKGSLLWDFVDHQTRNPISLSELPTIPRNLYFKVIVPILVNADTAELDNKFGLDRKVVGEIDKVVKNSSHNIPLNKVPLSAKHAFEKYHQLTLDSTVWNELNQPSKLHLLMPNGYEAGWAEAFNALNLTRNDWTNLPPSATCGGCAKFKLPAGTPETTSPAAGPWEANHFRDDGFEDIPTYLYTGGLIDMHDNVFISGLLYVPQAIELEAKQANVVQYIIGGVVVRDGFYIEEHSGNSRTIISSEPTTYSTAMVKSSGTTSLTAVTTGPAGVLPGNGTTQGTGPSTPPANGAAGVIAGNPGTNGSGSTGTAGATRWVEIKPLP